MSDRDELVIDAVQEHFPEEDRESPAPTEDELLRISREKWVSRTRALYEGSTDYLNNSIRPVWEKNLAHWRNQHASGSKFHSDNYKKRSSTFRPKTRSAMRSYEAKAAISLFTNPNLVSVRAANQSNPMQVVSAKINEALTQRRLEDRMWFLTCLGAFQDANNYGVCIGKAYWDRKVRTSVAYEPVFNDDGTPMVDEEGVQLAEEINQEEVELDQSQFDLVAPENFRFDPNCDWRNPAGTSPYLQELIPMYAGEVKELCDSGEFLPHDLGEIVSAGDLESETEIVRQAREGNKRRDPQEVTVPSEYGQVWIVLNIVNEGGEDWAYYTLGIHKMLTDPVPLKELFPLGRPYEVGYATLEAHRNYPAGINELSGPLQEEINSLANQRLDNVSLVLNKRYFLRRGADTDLNALMRNTPGGGVMVRDPINDVRVIDTPDVTSSSYAEQDRLNVELDDMLGTFSQSSIQSNRSLNETVGGMDLMKSGANDVQEYALMVWIHTWVKPMIQKIMKLEQRFQTDEVILSTIAADLKLYQRFGVDQLTDEMILQDVVATVDVGMGNTDPLKRLERMNVGIRTAAEIGAQIDPDKISNEIFSTLGFGDGSRFLMDEEKKAQMAENQPPSPEELQMQMKQMELEAEKQANELKAQIAQQERDYQIAKLGLEKEVAYAKLEVERANRIGDQQTKYAIEQTRDRTRRDTVAGQLKKDLAEMNLKRRMGSGI